MCLSRCGVRVCGMVRTWVCEAVVVVLVAVAGCGYLGSGSGSVSATHAAVADWFMTWIGAGGAAIAVRAVRACLEDLHCRIPGGRPKKKKKKKKVADGPKGDL
jgi:hypothetical protein